MPAAGPKKIEKTLKKVRGGGKILIVNVFSFAVRHYRRSRA